MVNISDHNAVMVAIVDYYSPPKARQNYIRLSQCDEIYSKGLYMHKDECGDQVTV